MRRNVLLSAAALVCLSSQSAIAQQPGAQSTQRQPARPGVIVVSYNKCRLDAVAKVDSLGAQSFYPVLDDVVREGRLLSWGVLTHEWGDEWNYVVYYTAANTAAFHAAWGEIVRRVGQRMPRLMADLSSSCTEHKDNIYSVMRLASATPPTTPAPR